MLSLSYSNLYNKISRATESFYKHVDELNAINFFPVVDYDTGTNMYATLKLALEASSEDVTSFPTSLVRLSKGNSGMILAQALRGFLSVVLEEGVLVSANVKRCLNSAIELAYKAVLRPKEGTMLTFIRLLAEIENWDDVSSRSNKITEALNATFKNGEYDAGAKGIYYFINLVFDLKLNVNFQKTVVENVQATLPFKYCTEFILNNFANTRLDDFVDFLDKNGDSVNYIFESGSLKAHIHTNEPFEILKKGKQNGTLGSVKIDNLKLESELRPNVTLAVTVEDEVFNLFEGVECEYLYFLNPLLELEHLLDATGYSQHIVLLTNKPEAFSDVKNAKLSVVKTQGYLSKMTALGVKQYADFKTYLQDLEDAAKTLRSVELKEDEVSHFLLENEGAFIVRAQDEEFKNFLHDKLVIYGVTV